MAGLRKYKSLYSSTTNSFGTGEAVTITPASVVGLPTGNFVLTFDRVDSSGTATPSKMERILGSISGGNFVVASSGRGYDGTTEQAHTSPVVEMVWNAADWNDTIDALTNVVLATTGAVDTTKVLTPSASATISGSDTFSGALVANSQVLKATRPKFVTSIDDTNGNELFGLTATASAVNEFTVANAATNTNPVLSTTGGDTNIGIDVKPKGTGVVRIKQSVEIPVFAPATDTATGDSKFFFRVPAEINGMNLVGVAACVSTAGTTNTTTVQIHRVRGGNAADMLSTRITIDSGEIDTSTAATAAAIDTSNDDVQTGDQIHIDVDAVSTTAAKGLVVELQFALP